MKNIFLIIMLCVSSTIQTRAQINQSEQSMWCWASCIQSALSQANIYETQSAIVARLIGYPTNRPANNSEVVSLLRSYNLRAWIAGYPASPNELKNALTSGWKVMAFVNPTNNPNIGHYIMLQGVLPDGQIVVSDPSNGSTFSQDVGQLYYSWNWSDSIVIGQ